MKILFYINTIRHGGAERVICNLATQFSDRGYDCVLATSFQNIGEYNCGKQVRRVSLFESKLKDGFLRRNIRLVKGLRKILKHERPDVLISFMAEPNFRAIMASVGLNNKVVISVRNDPNREYPGRLNRILAKFLFRFADGIVFQTEDAQKWFPKSIQKKSRIIFNQVDEIFYKTTYNGERHDIVTTGRLTAQKNHKMLIRAFATIADKISDNLIIYGEGELRGELESLIAELHLENRVFLPGCIENVADTIKSAKLFVLSSDYEGMPNSLMEAMALGIPCISTDCPCGGPRMLFGENLSDRLIPCGNTSKMSELIFQMLRGVKVGAVEKNLATVFSPDHVFEDWENYLLRNDKKSNRI